MTVAEKKKVWANLVLIIILLPLFCLSAWKDFEPDISNKILLALATIITLWVGNTVYRAVSRVKN